MNKKERFEEILKAKWFPNTETELIDLMTEAYNMAITDSAENLTTHIPNKGSSQIQVNKDSILNLLIK